MKRIKRRKEISPDLPQWYFEDQETDRVYAKVIGGIGWPSSGQQGAVVVLGQELVIRPPVPIFVLDVYQHSDLETLIAAALVRQNDFCVQDYYCDLTNESSIEFVTHRNRNASDKRNGVLRVQGASNIEKGNLSFHLTVLRGALLPQTKTLYLEGELTSELSMLPASDVVKVDDYPPITALCLSFIELSTNPFTLDSILTRPRKAKVDYDLFPKPPLQQTTQAKTDYDLFAKDKPTRPVTATDYDLFNRNR